MRLCVEAMEPVAFGWKNWLQIGSEEAGPKAAAIALIVETCRRLDVNLRACLMNIPPRLGDWPSARLAELSPAAWKPAHIKIS